MGIVHIKIHDVLSLPKNGTPAKGCRLGNAIGFVAVNHDLIISMYAATVRHLQADLIVGQML